MGMGGVDVGLWWLAGGGVLGLWRWGMEFMVAGVGLRPFGGLA